MKIETASSALPLSPPQTGPSTGLQHAAEQFEALFVGQMLHSVRESAEEEDGDDPGANSTLLGMAEEQLAQTIAARGGLGIATMVTAELENRHEN
jgi:peptidoglycan hydrolase FlgJ